jgi:hypothetical protein
MIFVANYGTPLTAAQATALNSFVALATTPAGYHLAKDSNGEFVNTADTGGGGGVPAGSNTQIQFNDSSAFGADADFTWNKTTNTLGVGASGVVSTIQGGQELRINSGGDGYNLELLASSGTSASSSGGNMTFDAGNASSTGSAAGGAIMFSAGLGGNSGGGTGAGGIVQLQAGNSYGSTPGDVNINAGNSLSGNNAGGSLNLYGGNGNGSGQGGEVFLEGGTAGSSGDGGFVQVSGSNAGTSGTGTGGWLGLYGGYGGNGGTSNGGYVEIFAGGAGSTGNGNGGNVTLGGGVARGSGTEGVVRIQDPSSSFYAVFDTGTLAATRTFTFPNATGTLALTSDIPTAATASDINTGTSTTKFNTPDALAGSNFGIRYIVLALNGTTALTTSDKAYVRIPAAYNGMNLVTVTGSVGTGASGSSSSGIPTFTVRNVTDNQQMLSTSLTIDVGEYTSATAATPVVINTTYDDVATDDLIEVAVTTSGTGVTYATLTLGFSLP